MCVSTHTYVVSKNIPYIDRAASILLKSPFFLKKVFLGKNSALFKATVWEWWLVVLVLSPVFLDKGIKEFR